MKVDCAIIGGGIVGLSVAMHLGQNQPGIRIVVLEKESELAAHQTGRNNGVIYSGVYYTPGSLKARYARQGNRSMIEFCEKHGVAHELCGKVIVATDKKELPHLDNLYERGIQNELQVIPLDAAAVREIEPHVQCLRGLRIPSTAIVDYRQVCAKYAELIHAEGGEIRKNTEVRAIRHAQEGHSLETASDEIETQFVINCAGLQSDRVARRAGLRLEEQIVPFRGEYYELVSEKRHLVKSLDYPAPDPSFPFLGVHFTKMIDGSVHAGPNAVLALQREGYRKTDVDLRDVFEMATYPGLWHLVRKHHREGLAEVYRSLSKRVFVRDLQRLIPEVTEPDLIRTKSGVRAQALKRDGNLVSDFLLVSGPSSIHVCNAPSPAATASLEIGKAVAAKVPELRKSASVGARDSFSSDV